MGCFYTAVWKPNERAKSVKMKLIFKETKANLKLSLLLYGKPPFSYFIWQMVISRRWFPFIMGEFCVICTCSFVVLFRQTKSEMNWQSRITVTRRNNSEYIPGEVIKTIPVWKDTAPCISRQWYWPEYYSILVMVKWILEFTWLRSVTPFWNHENFLKESPFKKPPK